MFVTPVQPSLVASSRCAQAMWTALAAVLSNGSRLACPLLHHDPNAVLANQALGSADPAQQQLCSHRAVVITVGLGSGPVSAPSPSPALTGKEAKPPGSASNS